MEENRDEQIQAAVRNTVILRPPRQQLATFGTTNVYYYLVSEPVYEVKKEPGETVVREGRIIAEKPKIVTPYYLSHLEGFGAEARRYFDTLIREFGANTPGLYYTYKNEPRQTNIVSDNLLAVVSRLNEELEKKEDPLSAIIKAHDTLWDVSLMRFIFEMTRHSIEGNVRQMQSRGLLSPDPQYGIPVEARLEIERMFEQVSKGERAPGELKAELDRWGIYEEYQDRFLSLFRE